MTSSSDLKKGAAVAQIAFLVVLATGLAEIVASFFAGSVALLADGIHSVATAAIFLIVWIGLHLSKRAPDGTFRFGYYRVETLGSLVAAFVLALFGGFVLFESYRAWTEQREIFSAETVIVVALASVILVVLVSLYVAKASKNYGLSALGVGGFTGWIDVSSSFAVVIGAALSKYFGILHADAIAGIIIAGAIFVGAYSIFKEASLVLVDACKCGDVINGIGDVAKSVPGIKEVHSIRMRKVGSYLVGDMHIVVDGDMPLKDADLIATKVEEKIKSEFGKILEVKVRIESDIAHDRHSEEFTIKKD